MRRHDYQIRSLARDQLQGHFTVLVDAWALSNMRRKLVEYRARARSRSHPEQLVVLVKLDGTTRTIVGHFLNGTAIDATAVMEDAGARSRQMLAPLPRT